ncbi:hypothetical protein Q9L58_004496 [Maublancomyces gigas]|uniref:F-box domain-containing protein n=1 Tax=Discina gigas TaxID=1032678 RepID=A0ABR3GKV0_9PEZI
MGSNPIPIDWSSSPTSIPTLATSPRSCTPNVPAEILHQIISYLPLSKSHPSRLAKEVLLSFSLTCCFFRDFFRNDVYSAITITSPGSLAEIVEYFNKHTWTGQQTAIKSLTLRWLQRSRSPGDQSLIMTETPASHNISSQQITLNLKILLRNHTSSLEELTLDFPDSGIHFQNAIISSRGIPVHQHLKLKRLHISNGLIPSSPPATFLLCAISSLCARSLEDLLINGGCSNLRDSRVRTREFFPNKLHVPGVLMFRRFEELQKLQRLHVKNLEGFDEECLSWVLSGEEMQSSCRRKGNRVLALESNPDLTDVGISNALESVKGGLEELNIAVLQKEEPLSGGNDFANILAAETGAQNDADSSYMCDIDSVTDTNCREHGHSDFPFISRASRSCSCGTTSRSSSKTCHQDHQTEQSASSIQSTLHVRLCDAARACRHLRRLETRTQVICHSSFFNSSPDYDCRSGNNTTRHSPPSTPLEDVAEDDNLSFKTTSSPSPFELGPTISPELTPLGSSHSLHTNSGLRSSEGRELGTLEAALSDVPGLRPSSLDEARQDRITKLRGGCGEAKGPSRLIDETLSRVERGFAKLRVLWKSRSPEKKQSKSRKRVSSEAAEV